MRVDATCRGAERRSLCGGAWWRRLGRCKRAFGCCSLSRCCCSTSPSLFLSLISPNKCSTGAAAFALTRSAPTSPWSEDEQKGRNVFCDLADFFVLFFFFFFLSAKISFVVTSVSSCGVLLLVVGRAKKCLDFCSTMYLYHMLVVFCLSGIPRSVLWWVLIVLGVVISTVCSELVCLRREMREIPVSSGSSFIV